jgi:hypothetical protein
LSVQILETVVRQSEVLAHRKKWLFCKVTPVSVQMFVEGLLRLANVVEVTEGTLRFLCIFSFIVLIVNEYFTTVTKLRI